MHKVTTASAPTSYDVAYRSYIAKVASDDAAEVLRKDLEYGASWKQRGGVGAFMSMVRKIDRLQAQVNTRTGWDIFAHMLRQPGPGGEGVRETISDLRRYLMLFEAEIRAMEASAAAVEGALIKSIVEIGVETAKAHLADLAEDGPRRMGTLWCPICKFGWTMLRPKGVHIMPTHTDLRSNRSDAPDCPASGHGAPVSAWNPDPDTSPIDTARTRDR